MKCLKGSVMYCSCFDLKGKCIKHFEDYGRSGVGDSAGLIPEKVGKEGH